MTTTTTAPAAVTVRFDRQYTTGSGNVFMRFVATDGRVVSVKVREGRDGLAKYTRREARLAAMRELGITVPCPNGCGGQVVAGAWIDPSMPCPAPRVPA